MVTVGKAGESAGFAQNVKTKGGPWSSHHDDPSVKNDRLRVRMVPSLSLLFSFQK